MTQSNTEFFEKDLSYAILNCAYTIHTELGPGLLESAYEECFAYELFKSSINFSRQQALPLIYKEVKMDAGYRVDLLIENKIIVEIKSVEIINPVHVAQVITYLKLSGCKVGFLINFNVKSLKDGIKRLVH